MMAMIRKMLKRVRDGLVRLLALAAILIMAVLTLDVLWGVFSRYVLGHQSQWTEEVATMLLMWVSLLGAALTYAEKGHLGVDYFVDKLDPSARRINEAIAHGVVGVFAVAVLTVGGWVLFTKTLASGQTLPALRIDAGYKYMVVPISGCFMTLFALEHMARELWPGKNGEAAQ